MAKTTDPAHYIRLLLIHTPGFVNPDYINKKCKENYVFP